jgi:catalase
VVNYNNFWDYLSANNESTLQVMKTFTDLGTPYGYRHMPGYSGNAFRLVKSDTEWYYAKFIVLPDAGIRNNTLEESINRTALEYDFGTTDLYNTST